MIYAERAKMISDENQGVEKYEEIFEVLNSWIQTEAKKGNYEINLSVELPEEVVKRLKTLGYLVGPSAEAGCKVCVEWRRY